MDREGRLQGASRRYIMSAVEASLRRLNTDYIDLYQQHIADPKTPIEETLRALDDLVRQGKVRYIGCSTLSAWQVVEAQWASTHLGLERYVACQERYSLLDRDLDRELMPVIESLRARADPVLAAGGRAADRQIPPQLRRCRPAPGCDHAACRRAPADRRELGRRRAPDGFLRGARPQPAGTGLELAIAPAGGRQRHRRRDERRAGRGQCPGRRLGLVARGHGRDRPAHGRLGASIRETTWKGSPSSAGSRRSSPRMSPATAG